MGAAPPGSPALCVGTRAGRDWISWQDRGLNLDEIQQVGVRNERKEWKRKDKNKSDRSGYTDCIHHVPARDLYFF